MKRIILIFFVITAGCSTACHSERTYKTGSGAANSAAKQDTTTTGAPSQDTLSLSGRCVIFFEPDAGEFDSLSAGNEANLGKLTSFRDYNKQIIPFLKKKKHKPLSDQSENIQDPNGRWKRYYPQEV